MTPSDAFSFLYVQDNMTKKREQLSSKHLYVCAGISGMWNSGLAHEVIHNRTVNIRGGLGHNISMDRVCEFLNAEFKGTRCTALFS